MYIDNANRKLHKPLNRNANIVGTMLGFDNLESLFVGRSINISWRDSTVYENSTIV